MRLLTAALTLSAALVAPAAADPVQIRASGAAVAVLAGDGRLFLCGQPPSGSPLCRPPIQMPVRANDGRAITYSMEFTEEPQNNGKVLHLVSSTGRYTICRMSNTAFALFCANPIEIAD